MLHLCIFKYKILFLHWNCSNFNFAFSRGPFLPQHTLSGILDMACSVVNCKWSIIPTLLLKWSISLDMFCVKIKRNSFSMNYLLSWITHIYWIHMCFLKVLMKEYSSKVWLGVGEESHCLGITIHHTTKIFTVFLCCLGQP